MHIFDKQSRRIDFIRMISNALMPIILFRPNTLLFAYPFYLIPLFSVYPFCKIKLHVNFMPHFESRKLKLFVVECDYVKCAGISGEGFDLSIFDKKASSSAKNWVSICVNHTGTVKPKFSLHFLWIDQDFTLSAWRVFMD